jgi:thioredoxin 1
VQPGRKNPPADARKGTAVAEAKPEKKSLLKKALLVIAILAAITAIWFVKNGRTQQDSAESVQQSQEDFVLEAEAIDLDALLAYQLPIIIDFGSDSCIPCKEMAPVLKSANADYQGRAIIKFVDVWKYTDAANGFPVQVIPTQILFSADGTPYVPSEDLGIEFIFYSAKDTQEHVFTAHQGGLTDEQMRTILADMGAGE